MMQWVAALISTLCFASFGWAILFHFQKSGGVTHWRMLALSFCGTLFYIAQILLIVEWPSTAAVGSGTSDPGISILMLTGLALILISLALFWWAVMATRRRSFALAFTPEYERSVHSQDDLVVSGPYRFVRHPFYASYLVYWTGGVFVTARWWMTASVFVMFIFYAIAASEEERAMLSGDSRTSYLNYSKRTGMFLPRLFHGR